MNITGIAVLSPSAKVAQAFHASLYTVLKPEGLTSGLCDQSVANGSTWETVRAPQGYIPKRPKSGEWLQFEGKISQVAQRADVLAERLGVWISAFSLEFRASNRRGWSTNNATEDLLLDRTYGECLQDVLEVLLYETPGIRASLSDTEGCALGIDLPSRMLGASGADASSQRATIQQMWRNWGIDAWTEMADDGQIQVMANTLGASDGVDVLTAALNRRKNADIAFIVQRARCCRLVTWSQWLEAGNLPEQSRISKQSTMINSTPRPKQIHYLADYLANRLFQGSIQPNSAPFGKWFDRGFLLSSADEHAGSWIGASRAFANGNRVEAIRNAGVICADPQHRETKTSSFFRRAAREWAKSLTGNDFRELFGLAPGTTNI